MKFRTCTSFLTPSIFVILSLALCQPGLGAPPIDTGLCSSDVDQAQCLENNFQALYEQNNQRFWKILKNEQEKAFDCQSQDDTLKFLKLSSLKPRGTEFEEYFSESVEHALIKNTTCILSAIVNLDSAARNAILIMLHRPLVSNPSDIDNIFRNAKSLPEYKNLANEYYLINKSAQ